MKTLLSNHLYSLTLSKMNNKRLFDPENKVIYFYSLVFAMMLFSSFSFAQTPTNFNGKWIFDKSKSDPGKGGSFLYNDIIHKIIRNPTSISIEEIIKRPGSEDVSNTEKFNLDGKETIEKSDIGTTKRIANWSEDKKILTLTTIMIVDSKDYRCDALY
jgi:hypothetical protein